MPYHQKRRFDYFFFNDTATTEIYTLSLHDALPISARSRTSRRAARGWSWTTRTGRTRATSSSPPAWRSEEHTSELQSQSKLACRLLLTKENAQNAPFASFFSSSLQITQL